MRIIHLNTSINCSSAPYKLNQTLLKFGYESEIMTLIPSEIEGVSSARKTIWFRIKRRLNRIRDMVFCKKYNIPTHTCIPIGLNLKRDTRIKNADVIWLHWIDGDFQSPSTINQLLKLGKTVIWTCHDNAPFTGGCHVRLGCNRYMEGCGLCPMYGGKDINDPSRILINSKRSKLSIENLILTAPSLWMLDNINKSALYDNQKKYLIPNIINTEFFAPKSKEAARDKYGINKDDFVVLLNVKADEKFAHNGMQYLWEFLERLEGTEGIEEIRLYSFGSKSITNRSKVDIVNLGYIDKQTQLPEIYSMADLFLVTSLEDSFNMTVAEAMSCGTPVLAFDNGGIADIIDHKSNGYLSRYKDVDDLMQGFQWIQQTGKDVLKEKARKKIVEKFSEEAVVYGIKKMLEEVVE